jgi:imidazolonepropionase
VSFILFIYEGTTFAECKSGYGLEWPTELKLLKVLTKAKREIKTISLTNTYLGGHSVPKGKTADEATDDIVNYQLNQLKKAIESKELDVDAIDVFCEKDVFNVEQSEKMLSKGKNELNLHINFHSDELYPLNSVEVIIFPFK